MTTANPDRVTKGASFWAHFTYNRNGYRCRRQRDTVTYNDLGFRTFRPGRNPKHPTP